MEQVTSKDLPKIFELAHHEIDGDRRFMGSNDLCKILMKENETLEEDTKIKIFKVFQEHLNDPISVVVDKAVESLASTFPFIPEPCIEPLFNTLFKKFEGKDVKSLHL